MVAETRIPPSEGNPVSKSQIYATRQTVSSAIIYSETNMFCVEARFSAVALPGAQRIEWSGLLFERPMVLDATELAKQYASIADLNRFLSMYEEDIPLRTDTADKQAKPKTCVNCPGGTIQTDGNGTTGRPPGYLMIEAKYLKHPVLYAYGSMTYGGVVDHTPDAQWETDKAFAPLPCIKPNAPPVACVSAYYAALEAELREDGVNTGVLGAFIRLIAGWYAQR